MNNSTNTFHDEISDTLFNIYTSVYLCLCAAGILCNSLVIIGLFQGQRVADYENCHFYQFSENLYHLRSLAAHPWGLYRLHRPGLTLLLLLAISDWHVGVGGVFNCGYPLLLRYVWYEQPALSILHVDVYDFLNGICFHIFAMNRLLIGTYHAFKSTACWAKGSLAYRCKQAIFITLQLRTIVIVRFAGR
jgi:hypothetical protein